MNFLCEITAGLVQQMDSKLNRFVDEGSEYVERLPQEAKSEALQDIKASKYLGHLKEML
jgi:hypothetical protein